MIQVNEALAVIAENSKRLPPKKRKVAKALGFVTAATVYSPIDMPPFRQSAMDGYAFSHSSADKFTVIGALQAGAYDNLSLTNVQAVRIFTGAFVPDGADTVVMQEHVTKTDDQIIINKMPNPLANVRPKGEQFTKGQLVLEKNTLLTPAAIGLLACLGITDVKVYPKPKVAVIVTGNELVKGGVALPEGKIYESNSVMLQAALRTVAINKAELFYVKDSLKATSKIIKKCLKKFDTILISGGISVGDYDFVKQGLEENGVEERFYKINQKPGKPLFFGTKEDKLIFALPGNPASSLTCFYVYVLAALKKQLGFNAIHLSNASKRIKTAFDNQSGKTLFLKGHFNEDEVEVLEGQSSAMLNSFAVANCFIMIPNDATELKADDIVTVIPFN